MYKSGASYGRQCGVTDLQPGDAFHEGRRSGQGAEEGGAQDGHAVEGLGDVVGSGAARAHGRDGGARTLQLVGHVLGVQLQEGVVVVEQHDQQHIDLQYRAPNSAAQPQTSLVTASQTCPWGPLAGMHSDT